MKKKLTSSETSKKQYLNSIIKKLGLKVEDFMYCLKFKGGFEKLVFEVSNKMFNQGRPEEDVIQEVYKIVLCKIQKQ